MFNIVNVRSKFQLMKKAYKLYMELQRNTGLGWDEDKQEVTCDEEYWNKFKAILPLQSL